MKKAGKQKFSMVVERDAEGYFVASVHALPGCHTQARSLDKLMERIREAIEVCFEIGTVPTGSTLSKRKILSGLHPDIRRLTGFAPAALDAKKVYHEHLARRNS